MDLFKKTLRFKVGYYIKIVSVVSFVLLFSTYILATFASEFFTKEISETYHKLLQASGQSKTNEVDLVLGQYINNYKKMFQMGLVAMDQSQIGANKILSQVVDADPDLLFLDVIRLENDKFTFISRIDNQKNLSEQPKEFSKILSQKISINKDTFLTELPQFDLVKVNENDQRAPVLIISFKALKTKTGYVGLVAAVKSEKLQKLFQKISAMDFYLISNQGKILAHPNEKVFLSNKPYDSILVQEALNSVFSSNHVSDFKNAETNEPSYGYYQKTVYGPIVLGQIAQSLVKEPAQIVLYRNYFIGGIIISISLFFIFIFSISLTSPIEKLKALTEKIGHGDFNVRAANLIKSRDEVEDLAFAFDKMTSGLKALFKTQGQNIAEALMSSDLDARGGAKHNVLVLFSDIRGFTSMSESESAENIVQYLNEYFDSMVYCIENNNGQVNKFIGDAIMAFWGAPKAHEQDPYRAVRSLLDMRLALQTLNEHRISKGLTPLLFGIGLNYGEAIAGTIGSKSRLEYTVIGDSVNTASRIESSCKLFGDDILVSQGVVDKVKDQFIFERSGQMTAKGKSEPISVFRLLGYVDQETQTSVMVQTPYSRYKAEAEHDKTHIA